MTAVAVRKVNKCAFLGSIYFGIYQYASLLLFWQACNPSPGAGRSRALQLHWSGQQRDEKALLCLACGPTAGRYFQRLCGCSASIKMMSSFAPVTPQAERAPLHHSGWFPPLPSAPIWIQHPLDKLFTKELVFDPRG